MGSIQFILVVHLALTALCIVLSLLVRIGIQPSNQSCVGSRIVDSFGDYMVIHESLGREFV